jgi:hypothetical protein
MFWLIVKTVTNVARCSNAQIRKFRHAEAGAARPAPVAPIAGNQTGFSRAEQNIGTGEAADVVRAFQRRRCPCGARRIASELITMDKTATIYHRDGRERTVDIHEASRLAGAGQDWSFVKPPPPGWELEIPRYRATRTVHPSPNSRHRHEAPFSTIFDNDVWQQATREVAAHEEFFSREWPHPSFRPLNYSAGRVLDFFNSRMKSRLPRAPFRGDRIVLDDGLTGPTEPNISLRGGVTAA